MVNIITTTNGSSSSSSRSRQSLASSPQPPSINRKKITENGKKKNLKKKKHTKKKMSIYSILFTIILFLIAIEIIAYTYINLPESNENSNEVQTILEQHNSQQRQQQQRQQQQQQQQVAPILTPKQQRQNKNQKLRLENQNFHDKQKLYEKQQQELRQSIQRYDNTTLEERIKTSLKIQSMGISKEEYTLDEIPPWSQIISNFNSMTNEEEPIILGLDEHCANHRQQYQHQNNIATGPAGMFSTGTNLIAILMKTNCRSPSTERTSRARSFNLIQVPWGKHNPADARTYRHRVTNPRIVGGNKNYDAVLPIVAIRHPYTWMTAMCRHSYQTRWKHVRDHCYESLYLQNPILKVPYGFKNYTTIIDATTGTTVTKNVTNSYQSLADMWVEWYKPYYLDTIYNNTPRIMVRHEDLVYRPKKVITSICECVGGTIRSDGFQYKEDSANEGKGHGKHRSGLLTAIIKYGQPLEDWYASYTSTDRQIMKSVFQGNNDNENENVENDNENVELMRTIYKTFQYKLYDDLSNPIRNTGWEQKMNPILFPPT